MNWTDTTELLASLPNLTGAACKGRAALFEATITEHGKTATKTELEHARTAALRTCADCPALNRCRRWFDSLPAAHRPRGVVAGQIVRSDGRILTTQTQGQ